jgi:hypothetical protein
MCKNKSIGLESCVLLGNGFVKVEAPTWRNLPLFFKNLYFAGTPTIKKVFQSLHCGSSLRYLSPNFGPS